VLPSYYMLMLSSERHEITGEVRDGSLGPVYDSCISCKSDSFQISFAIEPSYL
jgi:hypothetical protein